MSVTVKHSILWMLEAGKGRKIAPLGKRALTREYKGQKQDSDFQITQEASTILGGATCLKLGLVNRVHDVEKEKDILK